MPEAHSTRSASWVFILCGVVFVLSDAVSAAYGKSFAWHDSLIVSVNYLALAVLYHLKERQRNA